MNSHSGFTPRRVLVAVLAALIGLIVIAPLVYELSGVRSNLEERVVPTFIAKIARKTRKPALPTPTPVPDVAAPVPTRLALSALPSSINGVPVERIAFISESAREHIRDIYAQGQMLGRDARAVSKIGDSTMVYPPFLATFDNGTYRLGKYNQLQATIDYHAGSFARVSVAVKKGMHTWSQFDPEWAVAGTCAPGEGPLACEIRLQNPSIAIIRLGANDIQYPGLFEQNLGKIVKYCLARGIIPVLGTKPDRSEGQSNLINNLIRRTASAYSIPLWDYDLVAGTVPGRGLEPDLIHMRGGGTRDYASPASMRAGDALEDLTALIMLDAIQRELGVESLP